MWSNFVFIQGMEIYAGEGKADYEEISDSGKQQMGRMQRFPWGVHLSLPPALTLQRPGATLDTKPQQPWLHQEGEAGI